MIPPMHATVAGPEPEIAAKIALANTVILLSAPVDLFIRAEQKPIRRCDIPPSSMISPVRMKNGTASSVNESTPLKNDCIIRSTGKVENMKIYSTLATPNDIAIGTLSSSIITNISITINPLILYLLR